MKAGPPGLRPGRAIRAASDGFGRTTKPRRRHVVRAGPWTARLLTYPGLRPARVAGTSAGGPGIGAPPVEDCSELSPEVPRRAGAPIRDEVRGVLAPCRRMSFELAADQ